MASRQANRAVFAREAIRTFQSENPPPRAEAVELNAQAQRIADQFQNDALTPTLLSGLYAMAEFCLLMVAGLLAGALRVEPALHGFETVWASLAMAISAVSAIAFLHGYELGQLRSHRRQHVRLATGLGLAAAISAGGLFAVGHLVVDAAEWLVVWFLGSLVMAGAARRLLSVRIRRWARSGRLERRAVLVGGGTAAEDFIRNLERHPENDIRVCGIFDDRQDGRSPPIVAGYPKLGTIAELTEFARRARIDMLIVTLPLNAEKRILSILNDLWVLPLDIRISALSADLRFRPRSYSYLGDVPMLDVIDRPIRDWNRVAKRVFDLVFGTMALVAFSPLMVATAIAIRLDTPGPIFFRQKRHGFNNEVINVWKFRSLRHEMADPMAAKLVTRDDPRVTRVGRFIRRTSIDELPQLFNVLTGELSLVGPRPHAVHARSSQQVTFTEIVDGYFGRHKVKPGITGWAQIKGWRGEIDDGVKLQKRFEHDLFYIENWSLLMDCYVLAATPLSLVTTRQAY